MRNPPRPTLFPYTTLFRSHKVAELHQQRLHIRQQRNGDIALAQREALAVRLVLRRPVNALVDRKSTRLNSSHTVISYAVLCLKIKTGKISCTLMTLPATYD